MKKYMYICTQINTITDMSSQEKVITSLKAVTKSSVWDIQENDVFRLWESAEKDAELKDNLRHYVDIIKSAFLVEVIDAEPARLKAHFVALGYSVGTVRLDDNHKVMWAIKKKPISRITDLTYENIRHITAAKLLEVIDRNFGGGWDSLSQSIKDIIESAFDISTTTLPRQRLHKKGGMYEKKVDDGYEVLEVEKGSWVEAIFAKLKPEAEKPRIKYASRALDAEDVDDDADVEIKDDYNQPEEDDIEIEDPTDDEINEDNYSTMVEIDLDDNDEAEGLIDESDY